MAKKLPLSRNIPWKREDIVAKDRERLADFLKKIVRLLQEMWKDLVNTINYNAEHHHPRYVSQDAQPTPDDGEIVVWKDADATSGNSTHFLVYNDGGTVVTFASEETVP